MNEKIDFVITWVDGNDPKWLKEKSKYESKENLDKWSNSKSRYRDWDNLKYWFRSVEKYTPWVNKIYFITWGHIPEWLNINNKKLVIVKHKDFIPKEYLPTYNSNAIELNIHRIKDLSNNFVLFNDDMFINDYVKPTDFFVNNKPCEISAFDVINTEANINISDINNIKVLNKYFNKKEAIKSGKWFKLKYGKYLIKTLLLLPWKDITGLAEMHVPSSYNKVSFDWIWKKEKDICDKTCKSKFREKDNINHWVIKGYQLLKGNYYPRSSKFGKSYNNFMIEEIIKDIKYSKHKVICINDYECTDKEYKQQKDIINNMFMNKYPNKSKFEK